jgi:signal transduction histidine kinase
MPPVSSSVPPPERPPAPGAAAGSTGSRLERLDEWLRAHPRRVDLALAVLLAVPLGALTVGAVDRDRWGWAAAQLGCAAVVLAAPVVRRTAPAPSFAVGAVALAISELIPGLVPNSPFLPAAAVFPVALYSYCAYGGRRAPVLGALVGAAGALLITGRWLAQAEAAERWEADTVLGRLLLLGFLLAVVAAAVSFGIFRTVRTVYLATLEERARLAESEREERARRAVREERARIAREMHDVVAHSLSVIVSQAQGAAYVAPTRPDRAAQALDTIAETGRESLADMRGLLGVLRSEPAEAGAVAPGPPEPQPALADLPDLVERIRAAGVPVRLTETGTPRRLAPATALAVYRLVQESLTNTLKHAGPDAQAEVGLAWTEEELTVTITDDGYGETPGPGGGQGLVGMRERAAVLGGRVAAGPATDRGFTVEAHFPVGRS